MQVERQGYRNAQICDDADGKGNGREDLEFRELGETLYLESKQPAIRILKWFGCQGGVLRFDRVCYFHTVSIMKWINVCVTYQLQELFIRDGRLVNHSIRLETLDTYLTELGPYNPVLYLVQ